MFFKLETFENTKGLSEEWLIKTVERNLDRNIEEKISSIVNKINTFDSESVKDDITIIGIKILWETIFLKD